MSFEPDPSALRAALPTLPSAFERRAILGLWIFLLFVGAVPLAISFVVTPEAIEEGRVVLSPPCAWKALTGSPCPTCGLTRAFCAIGHGRLRDAVRHHPFSPVAYVGFGALVVFAARRIARPGS